MTPPSDHGRVVRSPPVPHAGPFRPVARPTPPTAAATAAGPAGAGHNEFQHEALFYAGETQYLAGTVPFVTEGLAAGEAVMVVVPEARLSALRSALGEQSGQVRFADMARVGANPAHIIPVWRENLESAGDGSVAGVRCIGETLWAGRGSDEVVECQRHEALVNVAFADSGTWRLLCPYDTAALDPSLIEDARRTHPLVTESGARGPSAACLGLDSMAQPFDAPLPPAPPDARRHEFSGSTLPSVRRFVAALGRDAGLEAARVDDLVVSVHEVAANSVGHGGGSGVATGWYDAERLVVEVADGGRVVDPLVGRRRPPVDRESGRGLWIATQLCDLMQLRTFASGTVVRLHIRRPA